MNLALQKRHEQLERWRQNEEAELQQQKQQQQQQQQQREADSSNQRGPTQTRTSTRFRPNSSDESSSSLISNPYSSNKQQQQQQQSVQQRANRSISPHSLPDDYQNDDENNNYNRYSSTAKSEKIPNSHRKRKSPLQTSTGGGGNKFQVKFTYSTLFLNACASGDLDECRRLLDDRLVDINSTTCDGLTGLHEAAICGNCEMVEYLLDKGANINCCDNEGWTPLHAAASLGQVQIVELLLEHQADATIVNCENFLAYDLARNDEVRQLIGDHLRGQDIDQLRRQEELMLEQDLTKWIKTGHYEERSHPVTQATVLHVLAAKGYVKLMKQLLETPSLKKKVNLEAKDNEGFTPLLAASFWNQTEIVELLIEHGANIFAQSNSGYKISSIMPRVSAPDPYLCLNHRRVGVVEYIAHQDSVA